MFAPTETVMSIAVEGIFPKMGNVQIGELPPFDPDLKHLFLVREPYDRHFTILMPGNAGSWEVTTEEATRFLLLHGLSEMQVNQALDTTCNFYKVLVNLTSGYTRTLPYDSLESPVDENGSTELDHPTTRLV